MAAFLAVLAVSLGLGCRHQEVEKHRGAAGPRTRYLDGVAPGLAQHASSSPGGSVLRITTMRMRLVMKSIISPDLIFNALLQRFDVSVYVDRCISSCFLAKATALALVAAAARLAF